MQFQNQIPLSKNCFIPRGTLADTRLGIQGFDGATGGPCPDHLKGKSRAQIQEPEPGGAGVNGPAASGNHHPSPGPGEAGPRRASALAPSRLRCCRTAITVTLSWSDKTVTVAAGCSSTYLRRLALPGHLRRLLHTTTFHEFPKKAGTLLWGLGGQYYYYYHLQVRPCQCHGGCQWGCYYLPVRPRPPSCFPSLSWSAGCGVRVMLCGRLECSATATHRDSPHPSLPVPPRRWAVRRH